MNTQTSKIVHIRKPYDKHQTGFTIVELLIVIVVIAILAAITIVAFNGIQDRAVSTTLQSDLNNASKKLKLYYVDYGTYPTSIDSVTYCPTPPDTNYCLQASSGVTFGNYSGDSTSFSLNAFGPKGQQYYVSDSTAATDTSSNTFTMAATTGTARTGSVLTAGAYTPVGTTANRQWKRSTTSGGPYTDIVGATNSTYTIPSGDIGYYVVVTATGTGSYNGSVTSAPTARITTLVTAIGAISGTPTVGQTLTAGARTPSAATVSYQWKANGANISGATASTFTLTAAQSGTTITVTATGTGNYTGAVTSSATATVN